MFSAILRASYLPVCLQQSVLDFFILAPFHIAAFVVGHRNKSESSMSGQEPLLETSRTGTELLLRLKGPWDRLSALPAFPAGETDNAARVTFDTGSLTSWNSALPVFALRAMEYCRAHNIAINLSGLPDGARRLVGLAQTVPARTDAEESGEGGFLHELGLSVLGARDSVAGVLDFIGQFAIAVWRMIIGKARFRRVDFYEALDQSGPKAIGIISLISVLVGTILAFIGAVQLQLFGAEIYVANLVSIGMMREMGALMTAIVMTGRTGAAFAARLGTMQVNEEVDALRTMAFDPVEFLVLPRVIAMCLMMPLLTIYSNVLGVIGGAVVGVFMLDITPLQYYMQTRAGTNLHGVAAGLIKSAVFALLVALCGCLNGIRCGRSALAVGEATTNAVVSGIVAIIVADSLLNIIYIVIGF